MSDLNTWQDFADAGDGPDLPLDDSQTALPVSGLLPSGEGGGFDYSQTHALRLEAREVLNSGINQPYPYPNQSTDDEYANSDDNEYAFDDKYWEVSGILKTGGPTEGEIKDTGVFNFNKLSSNLSNAQDVAVTQIENFTIFNNYIHHERFEGQAVQIPYISTFNVAIDFNAYP